MTAVGDARKRSQDAAESPSAIPQEPASPRVDPDATATPVGAQGGDLDVGVRESLFLTELRLNPGAEVQARINGRLICGTVSGQVTASIDMLLAAAEARLAEAEFHIRQLTKSRDRAERKQEAAESASDAAEAAVERVRALHDKTHWCFGGEDVSDLRDDCVFDPSTNDWPCPTLAALDPAVPATEGGDQ